MNPKTVQLNDDTTGRTPQRSQRADDSQANAELRQAFANHLPRRIELVQKRVHRLVKGAFDIKCALDQAVHAFLHQLDPARQMICKCLTQLRIRL